MTTVLRVICFLLVAPSWAEATEVYRRATVLEDRIGRIDVRSAYGTRLTVLIDCEDDRRGCEGERVYDEVIRLDFVSETRRIVGEEVVRTEERAGAIHLAIRFSLEDLERFRTELIDRLRRLSAQAFVEPFAGWKWGTPPFESDSSVSRMSEEPTWVCFQSDAQTVVARFRRTVKRHEDGSEEVSTNSKTFREPPTPLCAEMVAATAAAHPTIIETLPVPSRLLEVAVLHDDAVLLDVGDPQAPIERPEGVVVMKRPTQKDVSGEATGGGENFSYAQHSSGDGWRVEAYAEPAAMPIGSLDGSAWLHRWTIESVERQLGPRPTERAAVEMSLLVAYLATVPPIQAGDERVSGFSSRRLPVPETSVVRRVPAAIDRVAFLDALVDRLDRYHGPVSERIEDLVTRPEAGLESDGWIAVLCRQDGSAVYHLPPTKARQRVTNADLFCAALESRLR